MGTSEADVGLQSPMALAHSERDSARDQRARYSRDEGWPTSPVRPGSVRVAAEPSRPPGQLLSYVSPLQQRRCGVRHPLRGRDRGGDVLRQGTEEEVTVIRPVASSGEDTGRATREWPARPGSPAAA